MKYLVFLLLLTSCGLRNKYDDLFIKTKLTGCVKYAHYVKPPGLGEFYLGDFVICTKEEYNHRTGEPDGRLPKN